jgi:hypothetical protein
LSQIKYIISNKQISNTYAMNVDDKIAVVAFALEALALVGSLFVIP